MSTATEFSQAEITALVEANKRIAIRLGAMHGIDADEAQGMYACSVVEAARRFDPSRNASLRTFAEVRYRAALSEAASQCRYGIELDAEDAPELAADDHDDEEEPAAWRSGSEKKIAEKLALLPSSLRAFASLIVNGDSVEVASDKLGMTDRNGRYMVAQCLTLLSLLDPGAGQGCFELPAFSMPARPTEPKAKKSRIPHVAELPNLGQLGLF
ncbi:hypothetical protein [Dechloromonas hortensis]|uniref:hypothetical protein n=1 Tax=Dechloromonas hortensis TaxID=337779 RepID=UPI0012929C4F|nr:hypothetical protein [Dechloromonas hortensis]